MALVDALKIKNLLPFFRLNKLLILSSKRSFPRMLIVVWHVKQSLAFLLM